MYLFQDLKGIGLLKIIWGVFIVGNTHRALFLYRLSSWCYQHKLKPFATLFWSWNIALHSCDIAPSAKIGPGITMNHSVGIVIGSGVVIGKNLNIFQNVTIGTRGSLEYPTIGDNVNLYSGCALLGPIRVGDNVSIGANAVVLKNIPSNNTAVGVPAKVVNEEEQHAFEEAKVVNM